MWCSAKMQHCTAGKAGVPSVIRQVKVSFIYAVDRVCRLIHGENHLIPPGCVWPREAPVYSNICAPLKTGFITVAQINGFHQTSSFMGELFLLFLNSAAPNPALYPRVALVK